MGSRRVENTCRGFRILLTWYSIRCRVLLRPKGWLWVYKVHLKSDEETDWRSLTDHLAYRIKATPPAKAELDAERQEGRSRRAAVAEQCLEQLRDAMYYDNRMPFFLIEKLGTTAVMGNPVPHTDNAWWSAFDQDENSKFVEDYPDVMRFQPGVSQIRSVKNWSPRRPAFRLADEISSSPPPFFGFRHILCIDEADLFIARRADFLRELPRGCRDLFRQCWFRPFLPFRTKRSLHQTNRWSVLPLSSG